MYQIVYQANTPAGRGFDVTLLVLILAGVLTIMLDSVAEITQK